LAEKTLLFIQENKQMRKNNRKLTAMVLVLSFGLVFSDACAEGPSQPENTNVKGEQPTIPVTTVVLTNQERIAIQEVFSQVSHSFYESTASRDGNPFVTAKSIETQAVLAAKGGKSSSSSEEVFNGFLRQLKAARDTSNKDDDQKDEIFSSDKTSTAEAAKTSKRHRDITDFSFVQETELSKPDEDAKTGWLDEFQKGYFAEGDLTGPVLSQAVNQTRNFVVLDSLEFTPELRYIHTLMNPPAYFHPWLRWLLYSSRLNPEMVKRYQEAMAHRDRIYLQAAQSDGNLKIRYDGKILTDPLLVWPDEAMGLYELVAEQPNAPSE